MHYLKQFSLSGESKVISTHPKKARYNHITNKLAQLFLHSKKITSSLPRINSNFIPSKGTIFIKAQVFLKVGVCLSLNNIFVYHLYLNKETSSSSVTKVTCSVTLLLTSLNKSSFIYGSRIDTLIYIFPSCIQVQVDHQKEY